jgi:two-component system nitrogen regulation sensor histidine kinase GlnL
LVAKVIGDHGGIVEFESQPRRTTFRVLMPLDPRRPATASGAPAGGGAERRGKAGPGRGEPAPAATGRPR